MYSFVIILGSAAAGAILTQLVSLCCRDREEENLQKSQAQLNNARAQIIQQIPGAVEKLLSVVESRVPNPRTRLLQPSQSEQPRKRRRVVSKDDVHNMCSVYSPPTNLTQQEINELDELDELNLKQD